jgi:hypothetical protein
MIEEEKIKLVSEQIVKACNPIKIILMSHKISVTSELISFKLCVVVHDDVPNISELECNLYMEIDSEIPYDMVIYKESEWNKLICDHDTFASKINRTGTVIYEQGV